MVDPAPVGDEAAAPIGGVEDEPEISFFKKVVNTPRYLVYMGLMILVSWSAAFHFMEHYSYFNSLYWVVITAVGVGYGDITPHTNVGKILAESLALVTMFLYVPMIVGSIVSRLVVDRNAFTRAAQEEIKHALRKIETADHVARNAEEERESGA